MTTVTTAREPRIDWEPGNISRIPFAAYTDPDVYRRELERLFYSGHWCYVGLECEIPQPGDFRTSFVGERSVIMVRDVDGSINVVENRLRTVVCGSASEIMAIRVSSSALITSGITISKGNCRACHFGAASK